MYQKNNLAEVFFKFSREKRLSSRLPDYTNITTLYYMNRAINCCDQWNNFLDIGASDGHYSIPLLKKFCEGTAVEMDNNQSLVSLKKDYGNFNPIIGTISDIKPGTKFDFILMADVFEHIPLDHINDFCLKLSEIQDVGGVIYIMTPNAMFCGPASKSDLFHKINNNEHHGHQKHYLSSEIEKLFLERGYSLLFKVYEESKFRRIIKRIILGFSIRDNKYQKSIIYKTISPIFIYPIKLFLLIFARIGHNIELLNNSIL